MSKNVYDEWLKINVEIHNKLEMMKELEKEKNSLIKEAEVSFSEEVKVKMNNNIKKYEILLAEVKTLKIRAKELQEDL